MALFDFFQIPLRIFYLDLSKGNEITCLSLPDITPNDNDNILKSDS